MTLNPVFVNELRQSLFRRKPVRATAIWAVVTAVMAYITQIMPANLALIWIPMIGLPLIVPAFSSGAFAKEYEQQTWQDLYLTRLSNAQVVLGKFGVALLMVMLAILSFMPAIALVQGNFTPGWWMIGLTVRLVLSASLYILLGMVCSRYSTNRRTALGWTYFAFFLYAAMNYIVWSEGGALVENMEMQETGGGSVRYQDNPMAPGFMQGIHLIFCSVVGTGCLTLLWVSMSEQRGYKSSKSIADRAWQPVGHRSRTHSAREVGEEALREEVRPA